MLHVQKFQHTRQHNLKDYERLRSAADHNFLLCSNQYAEKLSQISQPVTRASTPNVPQERTPTLLILTRIPSLVSLQNKNNSDLSILNIVSVRRKKTDCLANRNYCCYDFHFLFLFHVFECL
jgi:hypothetical protein